MSVVPDRIVPTTKIGDSSGFRTPRFVTASLHVDYLRPTPLGPVLELRGRAVEVKERKVIVELTISAAGSECARARVIAVRAPASMRAQT